MKFLLHVVSDSNKSDIISIIFLNESVNFFNWGISWGFELNIHRYALKQLENLFQGRNFFIIGNNRSIDSKVEFDLILKLRKLDKIKLLDFFINPACS